MSNTTVDQIKSKLDILSVVSTYMTLEKSGINFKGKCPFHNEKTPSFYVSPERNSFYCFGCHAKGDIFTFVQEFEGLDFKSALKMLAERAGVTLENNSFEKNEDKSELDLICSALELATFYFQRNLSLQSEPSTYLESRGVTPETLNSWQLGFALPEWRGLQNFLLSKGVTNETMEKAGLVKRKAKTAAGSSPDSAKAEFREGTTDTFYDVFRGRIMFPMWGEGNKVIAFSGRIIPSLAKGEGSMIPPKYVNSPETVLFNKSETLYGLNKAKSEIRSKDFSIIVEGQMDLVMMHQAGFTNTVATSGTALTSLHLEKLKRISKTVVFAFDGDKAGLSAVHRSGGLALGIGLDVRVARMSEGVDPADLALNNKELLTETIAKSEHIIEYLTKNIVESTDTNRARAINENVLPLIALLKSSSEKAEFVRRVAEATQIKEEALWEDLKQVIFKAVQFDSNIAPKTEKKEIIKLDRTDNILRNIFGILMWQKQSQKPIINVSEIEMRVRGIIGEDKYNENLQMYSGLDPGLKSELLFEVEARVSANPNGGAQDRESSEQASSLNQELFESLNNLEEEFLKKKLSNLTEKLKQAEVSKDTLQVKAILEESHQIGEKIHILKNVSKSQI